MPLFDVILTMKVAVRVQADTERHAIDTMLESVDALHHPRLYERDIEVLEETALPIRED